MSTSSQFLIVIVSYHSERYLEACLDSVVRQTVFPASQVVVVDNNSQDGTLAIARDFEQRYPQIHVMASPTNMGFGTAINRAAAAFQSDYLYLLNPDAVLMADDDLCRLSDALQAQTSVAVVGSAVVEPDGRVIAPRKSYPEQAKMPVTFEALPGDYAWLIGASLLIDHAVFRQVGGFDEDYFLYGEEVDLCLRIRQQGHALAYFPEVSVTHIGSASADQLGSYQKKVLKTKGRYLFCYKHYPKHAVERMIRRDGRRAWLRYHLARFSGSKKALIYKAVYDVAAKTLLPDRREVL